ncbi:hypothetical protein [Sneathiella glossodoripedis]|uniref:hypothetical protein n=1 Tax=Sneathiella glossodoripedis TaxID=418853 RepID=UPI000471B151|nr:hypothetical protein [Sneathiella glossodoripedis]
MVQSKLSVEATYDLPKLLWLGVPPFFLVAVLGVRWLFPEFAANHLNGETGIIENLTVVILIPAILLAGYIASNRRHLPENWMWYWYMLLGLACLYFAGEEASWGQHWFGWETPESMKKLNDQGETNFHNMSSWLDQKPRLLVELSANRGGGVAVVAASQRHFF